MISSLLVLEMLALSDPWPITEPVLRIQLCSKMGGRPIGNAELSEPLDRLAARRWVVQTRNEDGDPLWGLTADGRTEAQKRIR
jgi:hypothetical protein